mgnify:FL=1|tara:strand:- start:868 stop:1386 length:519 start_codon:yes stop_codon:yes gene_type:complete
MKIGFFIIIIILKFNLAKADEKIAFIDLNYIFNNSISGKSINKFINNSKKIKVKEFKAIENKIKNDENDLISKKNIIEKSVYNEKVSEIRSRINNYKIDRQNFNKSMEKKKIIYTNRLLEKLNPIISEYVEKNSITLVLPKKMIIIGKKNLDITLPVIKILDETIQEVNFNE